MWNSIVSVPDHCLFHLLCDIMTFICIVLVINFRGQLQHLGTHQNYFISISMQMFRLGQNLCNDYMLAQLTKLRPY